MKRYVALALMVLVVAVGLWRLLPLTHLEGAPPGTSTPGAPALRDAGIHTEAEGPSATPPRPTPPTVQDARIYAEEHDIPVTEAAERLRLMQRMGALHPRLEAAFPKTFAGLWIRHEPDFALVVHFTEDPGPALERHVEGEPYAHLVVLRVVGYSLAALKSAQAEVLRRTQDLGLVVESGIDVPANRVTLYTADAALLETTFADAGVTLPEAVFVNEVEGMTPPETLYGGVTELTHSDGDLLYFPQQPPTLSQMAALLEGELVEEGGCLRVATDYDDARFLVLWPYDFAPRVGEEGAIEVVNGAGEVVARVGEEVRLGGGAMESAESQVYYDDLMPGLPIEGCPGPYWVTGSVLP